jgi:hypothetical protein
VIPSSIGNLSKLKNMYLLKKQLRQLAIHYVSYNQLTGTLPDEIFNLPNLYKFAAIIKCMDGTIPISICNESNKILTIALEGISSASSCQYLFFPKYFHISTFSLKYHNSFMLISKGRI